MIVTTAKPPGRPREILEMLLDKALHTPGQSVALAFAGTGEETPSLAVRTSHTLGPEGQYWRNRQ
jgi:hypothetical protein